MVGHGTGQSNVETAPATDAVASTSVAANSLEALIANAATSFDRYVQYSSHYVPHPNYPYPPPDDGRQPASEAAPRSSIAVNVAPAPATEAEAAPAQPAPLSALALRRRSLMLQNVPEVRVARSDSPARVSPQEETTTDTTTYGSTSSNAAASSNVVAAVPINAPRGWTYGLCQCTDDMEECCDTVWCSCCKFGRVEYRLNHSETGFDFLPCFIACTINALYFCSGTCAYAMIQRSRVAHRYVIAEPLCESLVEPICCACCVVCQYSREMKARGEPPGGVCCGRVHKASVQDPIMGAPLDGTFTPGR